MSSQFAEFSSQGLNVAVERVDALGVRFSKEFPLQGIIQDVVSPTMRRRFESLNQSKTDEGGAWVPNTPVTQLIRQKQGYPAKPQMNRSKALKSEASNTGNWRITSNQAVFRLPTSVFYGELVHTGFALSPQSMVGKSRRVPKRPWIYFSEVQIRMMGEYMSRWISEEMDDVFS